MSERRKRTPPAAATPPCVQRLTLDIPKALHKRLKRMALEEETSILALVTGWLRKKSGAGRKGSGEGRLWWGRRGEGWGREMHEYVE